MSSSARSLPATLPTTCTSRMSMRIHSFSSGGPRMAVSPGPSPGRRTLRSPICPRAPSSPPHRFPVRWARSGLTNGIAYSFAVTATNAVGSSAGSALSNPVIPAAHTRLAGADRYATAVAISQYGFQPQSPGAQFAVTVASGTNFPDAFAAGPVAAAQGGPLLLVPQDGALPAAVSDELRRLNPSRVDIAGGTAAVSSVVQSASSRASRALTPCSGGGRVRTGTKLPQSVQDSPAASARPSSLPQVPPSPTRWVARLPPGDWAER